MNSFAGIFWLVLAQLQNHFFIEHLPVAAYVRFLKEKDILLCGITRFSRGNKNKLRTFQPQKWKKIRTASLKQNLLVLIKKYIYITWEPFFLESHSQNVVEKLFPDPFLKNQNWTYLWMNSLKFHTVSFHTVLFIKIFLKT